MTRAIVLGIGRADSEDDAAGPAVIDRLRQAGVAVDLRTVRADPGDLAEAFRGRDHAVVIDACKSGAAAGTVRSVDLAAAPLPEGMRATHGIDLAQALNLVRILQGLPATCTLIAIEGRSFRLGHRMGDAVADAVQRVATELRRQFATVGGRRTVCAPPDAARAPSDQ